MSHVLVCGSAGYVGSALVPFLRTQGHLVAECDTGWYTPVARPRDYGTLTSADLADVDAIVVLAGHSAVHMSEGQAAAAYDNNVINLAHLLSISGDRQVVYASTSALYGHSNDQTPVDEFAPILLEQEYDFSKWRAEELAERSGKPVVRVRFGTVCGYSPNLRTDLMLNRMVHEATVLGRLEVTPVNFWRPILDIRDLCRAIDAIVRGPARAGVYHLASYNARLHDLAREVRGFVRVPLYVAPTGGSPYSMRLDTSRFEQDYAFTFEGSTTSIVTNLLERWDHVNTFTDRSQPRGYARTLAAA